MIDTSVLMEIYHIIEPGPEVDTAETSTESMYGMATSIHGNLLYNLVKDRDVILMVFRLLLTVTITLLSIGRIQFESVILMILVVTSMVKSKIFVYLIWIMMVIMDFCT